MTASETQRLAISHGTGPAICLAGPGSGKTFVITKRLARLIETFPQAKILSLTFSRASAEEMKKRFSAGYPSSEAHVKFSTVHSISYEILRTTYKDKKSIPAVIEEEKAEILKKLYYEVNNLRLPEQEVTKLSGYISRVKTGNVLKNAQIKNFRKIYDKYVEYKRANNLIDYDDMIDIADDYLKDHRIYTYDFVQVDEAQDLSLAQFRIALALARNSNIFIVADDDQSIYAFRGAEPQCLFEFKKMFPFCADYFLCENYRSAPNITALANFIIQKNETRFKKDFVPINKTPGTIKFLHSRTSYHCAKYIVRDMEDAAWNSVGILYRNNASAFSVSAMLISKGISFCVSGGTTDGINKYIDLFCLECTKKRTFNFTEIMHDGFMQKCLESNPLHARDRENIEHAIDYIYTAYRLCRNLEDFRTLAYKMNLCFERKIFGDKPRIFLSSVHSSKGLEYDSVYLLDVNKNEFPGKSANKGYLLEEERRLFYVAITRAKSSLNVFYLENHAGKRAEASILYNEGLKALARTKALRKA